jgi:hypothetical protein
VIIAFVFWIVPVLDLLDLRNSGESGEVNVCALKEEFRYILQVVNYSIKRYSSNFSYMHILI